MRKLYRILTNSSSKNTSHVSYMKDSNLILAEVAKADMNF